MKKLGLPLLLLLSSFSFGQISINAPSTAVNKWTFGGGIGVGFGSNSYLSLQAAPRVGYKLTEDLEAGAMGSISWQKSNYYNSTMFGIGPFANYYFARSFFVSGNFQHYFINYKDKFYGYKSNAEESALYLGGGYMQRLGNNSFLQIGAMYNVLYKEGNSIFSSGFSPNIGFVVGL